VWKGAKWQGEAVRVVAGTAGVSDTGNMLELAVAKFLQCDASGRSEFASVFGKLSRGGSRAEYRNHCLPACLLKSL